MGNRWSGAGRVAVVAAVLLLATAVRLTGLDRESLWFDEVESARLSDGDVAEVCHDSAASVHPPLYFLGLRLVRKVAGSSEVALRLPSVAASLVGLLLLYLLAAELVGRGAALLALAMTAGAVLQARTPLKADWRGLAREWPQGSVPAHLVCYPEFIAYCVGHYLGRVPEVSDGTSVLAAAPDLTGREVWVVAARDFPFELRPEDARAYRRLLAPGPRETSVLASAWRLDRVRVQPHPGRPGGGGWQQNAQK